MNYCWILMLLLEEAAQKGILAQQILQRKTQECFLRSWWRDGI
jgi:hypothetical protein